MGLAQPVITQQMVIAELTKAGINRDIAIDLSYRYYKNELTHKDIEYLETTFNLRLEKVESLLQAEIKSVKTDLDTKIDIVRNELKSDIKDLDNKIDIVKNNLNNKIDTKFNELDNKIDTVRSELKSDIKDLDTKIDNVRNEVSLVRKDIEIIKLEIKKDLSNLEKNNKWVFSLTFALWLTVLGGFIALILK
ncbi:Bdr family repetitive protein (plasmid) [Borrelia puertoricensis]|uniref:Bdr family repetitive protein n=1 Tax=Borrelia puertoricensis TaxID=2756107 RepID=UPI003EBD1109